MSKKSNDDIEQKIAKALAVVCVRDSYLEKLHQGIEPHTEAGDYSDVKVVTPEGEIPWNEVAKISQDEMKTLMKIVVNRLFTYLKHEGDIEFNDKFYEYARKRVYNWDDGEFDNFMMNSFLNKSDSSDKE